MRICTDSGWEILCVVVCVNCKRNLGKETSFYEKKAGIWGTMDTNISGESCHLVDLESGKHGVIDEQGARESTSGNGYLTKVRSDFVGIDGLVKDEGAGIGKSGHSMPGFLELPVISREGSSDQKSEEEDGATLLEKKPRVEKTQMKSCKKPPRPPRHSRSLSLDAADQKLIKELSELAMLKRARIERMKKKLKSTRSASSNGNLFAWIITVLFCLVILWEGFSPQGVSSMVFHGSPESSVQNRGGLITIHFYNNMSRSPQSSHLASPNNMELAPLLDNKHGRKLGRIIQKL